MDEMSKLMRNWLNNFRYFDVYIATSSTLLLVLGLLMIYSTTLEDASNLMWRQLAFAIAGYVGLFALAFFDYRKLKNASWVVYLGVVLSLISVWLFGETIQGSTRWFDVGFFLIQPSEFAKLGMVIVMAKFLDRNLERIKDFRYVAMFAIYAGFLSFKIIRRIEFILSSIQKAIRWGRVTMLFSQKLPSVLEK